MSSPSDWLQEPRLGFFHKFLERGGLISSTSSLFLAFIFSGCFGSSKRVQVSQLQPLSQPTFGGLTHRNVVTSSIRYTLTGECDIKSEYLEYSNDMKAWTKIEGGCKQGNFTVGGNANPMETLYVRAVALQQTTFASEAVVKFVPAPSASFMSFVNSTRSDAEGAAGTQNSMSQNFSGTEMTTPSVRLDTFVTEVVYE